MASTAAAAAAAASATTAAAGAKIEQVSVDVEEKDFRVCAAKPRAISLRDVAIALDETGEQRERRIHNLFGMFDKSHSGSLDHVEIEEGFKSLSIPSHYKYAQDLLQACDCNQDGRIDYEEFKNYIDEKEMELYQIFQQIDVSNDGYIHPEELRAALSRAGINFNDKDLSRFVDRMDQDNNGIITFEEWRDFLLLYPHKATLTGIYQYWEKFSQVDIGEQAVIPEGISRHGNASKYLIAGGIAGAVSRTSTAPLDRLKVLLQVQTMKEREGVIKGLMRIYKESGVAGYFRGNGINVVKVAPESAIKFYSFELIKDFILASEWRGRKGDIGGIERLFAGGTAGAIAQTIVYPMEVVKTRLQTYPCLDGKAPHMSRLLRDIFICEGPQAFFRGLIPSLIGIIPYAGIDLAAYETLKDLSRRFLLNDTEPGPWTQLACGTISGATGATCVYPLQVIRTRLQAQSPDSPVKYKGMTDVFVKTLKQEGISGFYKGLMPNLLKVAPTASITYIVYEDMKKRLSLS